MEKQVELNKESTEEEQSFMTNDAVIDGKPLSDGEIELIRALRNSRIFSVLGTGEYDEQFSVAYVNDDYKLEHMDYAVVIELWNRESQEHIANVFDQIRKEQ